MQGLSFFKVLDTGRYLSELKEEVMMCVRYVRCVSLWEHACAFVFVRVDEEHGRSIKGNKYDGCACVGAVCVVVRAEKEFSLRC